jgi:hypothetical protein
VEVLRQEAKSAVLAGANKREKEPEGLKIR